MGETSKTQVTACTGAEIRSVVAFNPDNGSAFIEFARGSEAFACKAKINKETTTFTLNDCYVTTDPAATLKKMSMFTGEDRSDCQRLVNNFMPFVMKTVENEAEEFIKTFINDPAWSALHIDGQCSRSGLRVPLTREILSGMMAAKKCPELVFSGHRAREDGTEMAQTASFMFGWTLAREFSPLVRKLRLRDNPKVLDMVIRFNNIDIVGIDNATFSID